jgi:tRNA(fMet)-specific endonuclease VapC
VERLIFDTGALIALERAGPRPDEPVADEADVAIAAVTAAELLVGVELADDAHRDRRREFVEGVLERVEVLAFDLTVARHHAKLLAHVRRAGRLRGAHDLQIAATARASDRIVITTDADAFADLPLLTSRTFTD